MNTEGLHRRRHWVVIGAVMVALVATVAACHSSPDLAPAARPTSPPTQSTTPAAAPSMPSVPVQPHTQFGPTAVDGITLGMTAEQVKQAGGTIGQTQIDSNCVAAVFPGYPRSATSLDVLIAPGVGVVSIQARPDMRTPAGARVGMIGRRLEKLYPHMRDGFIARIGRDAEYWFDITETDGVEGIRLEMTSHADTCE